MIFAPIDQVGWASAWAGTTSASRSCDQPRNGPPDAVSTSDSSDSGAAPSRHCCSAECSLSTGSSSRPLRRTAAVTSSPPATRLSLLASARSLPASSAAIVASRPAAPTIAFSTTSARSSRTSSTTPSCPPSTRPSNSERARAAAAGSASAIAAAPCSRAAATTSACDPCAARPARRRSGWSRTISSACRPTEPVAPRMATVLMASVYRGPIAAPLGDAMQRQRHEEGGGAGEQQARRCGRARRRGRPAAGRCP